MNGTKKILSVLLAALLCALCVIPALALTDPAECAHPTWELTDVQLSQGCVAGYYRYTCADCGVTKEVQLPAEDHNWQWVVDMPPTRYSNGVQHQVCANCGAVQNMDTRIPSTEQGSDFGAAIHGMIDVIGNFFLNIINQIRAFFGGIQF